MAWNLWFYPNTRIVLLIKLQALALVTLLTCFNYITKYITSIFLKMLWYYLLVPVAKPWEQTHLERYVPVPLDQSLFYQTHTLVTNLWLLLLNLKISITVSNLGCIWKHKRYARKSQNDASINQITLKSLTYGEWPSGLRRNRWIGGFLVQTTLSPKSSDKFRTQPRFEVFGGLCSKTWIKVVINIGWVTLFSQKWPKFGCGSAK